VAVLLTGTTTVGGLAKRADHIARVDIAGVITGDERMLELLEQLEEADQVKAVLIKIDSPGGTTAGSEALYLSLRQLNEKKPVVTVMDTVAASGGYITAIAADHIVARGNTITGSVGVLFQWAQVQELLDTLGIEMQSIKSGALKAEPNLFEPTSERAREVTEQMVNDSFRWFMGLVEERRKLSPDQLRLISDGRVFTGRQAVEAQLVDEIGGEEEAKAWLAASRDVDEDLEIVDWDLESGLGEGGIGFAVLRAVLSALGFGEDSWIIEKITAQERLSVDGLISVWHPDF
ncbi:MAG: signal peptide peptidase SppA, partial [Hyphomicrobiales bacterium]